MKECKLAALIIMSIDIDEKTRYDYLINLKKRGLDIESAIDKLINPIVNQIIVELKIKLQGKEI